MWGEIFDNSCQPGCGGGWWGWGVCVGDFGKAFWCVGRELENNGVRTDVAAWFPWVDTRGAMRCLSEWTEAFLRDGGVARTEPVLSGLRPSSAMAVWPGNPRESAGAGPDCTDCSSRAGKHRRPHRSRTGAGQSCPDNSVRGPSSSRLCLTNKIM